MPTSLSQYLTQFGIDSERERLIALRQGSPEAFPKERELFEARALYRSDLFALCYDLLGYDLFIPRLHDPLCRFMQRSEYSHCLAEYPRGHFKSTAKHGWIVQFLLRHPEAGVLMVMSSADKVRDFCKPIRNTFLKNEKFRALFPDYCPPPDTSPKQWGTLTNFTIPKLTKIRETPSFIGKGIKEDLTGYHPQLVVCDDIVDEDDTSDATIHEAILQFRSLIPLLDPGSYILYIGTRFADYDVQGMIRDGKFGDQWEKLFLQATVDGTMRGEPTFPERFSRADLDARLDVIGPYLFSTQYLLEPVPDEEATLKREWFEQNPRFRAEAKEDGVYINGQHRPLNVYMVVDGAYTIDKHSDNTAIVIGGIDEDRHWWLLDEFVGRLEFENLLPLIVEYAHNWGVRQVGFEANAFQGNYFKRLKAYCREQAVEFTLRPLSPQEKGFSQHKKEDRIIQSCAPALSLGRIHLAAGKFEELINECARIPRGRHDDEADAFGYLLGWFERPPRVIMPERRLGIVERHKKECVERALQVQRNLDMTIHNDWPLGSWS